MKNIQTISILFLVLISNLSFGQNDSISIDGKGFRSVFKDIESGKFNGTINGLLIIKNTDNEEMILDFQGSPATLQIEKDKEEIYDISYKKYSGKTTSEKTTIKYETYANANSLGIELNGEYFELSLIDGACDLAINGLNYTYVSEKKAEYLIITFSKEVILTNSHKHKIRKSIKVSPNSTLIFSVNR